MIYALNTSVWNGSFSAEEQEQAIRALENGQVIYLPNLPFTLSEEEDSFLDPQYLQGNAKNISFDANVQQLKGTVLEGSQGLQLTQLMVRYVQSTRTLLNTLIPHYQNHLITGRTSFRPVEIHGRKSSPRQDDTRLHVDAFPSAPNQGKRILRIFTNINPNGKGRHWHLGEPFEAVIQHFFPKLKNPLPGSRKLLHWAGITKSYRSLYDHYMLLIHDNMKLNEAYQQNVEKLSFHFPAGSSWIIMSDCVSHAALAGQHLLEQTFYLPINAMRFPEVSPKNVLERYLGKSLSS